MLVRAAVAAIVLGVSGTAPAALAQDWPSRPVKIISPFTAGGPTDILARPIAEHLNKVLGQPFIIENRAGGGTTIGAQAAARSEPDGYTLFIGTNTPFALAPTFNPNAGYTAAAFDPVILIGESPMVLCASLNTDAKTTAELVAAARKAPASFSFASVGTTTTTHLLGEWFNQITGLKMAHVPYRGSAPAMNDLVGGQVQVFFDAAGSAIPLFLSEKVRILMVLHEKRSPLMPTVPTSKEAGYPAFLGTFWGGIAAPAGTPQPIIDRLNREVNAYLKNPDFIKLLANVTFNPVGGTPAVLAERIKTEAAIWREVGEKAGLLTK